jgi:hypothetical protein
MFGLWGAQLACLIAVVVGYILQVERIREVTGLKLSDYRKTFIIPVAVSLWAVLVCLGARTVNVLQHPLPNIVFGVVGCTVVLGIAGALYFREQKSIARLSPAIRPAFEEQR